MNGPGWLHRGPKLGPWLLATVAAAGCGGQPADAPWPFAGADYGPGLPPPVAAPESAAELDRHLCDCWTCRRRRFDPREGAVAMCPRATRLLQEAFYGRRRARRMIREDLHAELGGNESLAALPIVGWHDERKDRWGLPLDPLNRRGEP